MNEIIKQIGIKIKEYRKKAKLTQAELAEKINVDSKYISRLETGTSIASISTIVKISDVLNVELSEIFTVETIKNKNKIIELINSKLLKINLKDLKSILEIVSCIAEK